MTRFGGLPCKHMWCLLQTYAAVRPQDYATFVSSVVPTVFRCTTFVDVLEGVLLLKPPRAELKGTNLHHPPCAAQYRPKANDVRIRGGEERNSSSTRPAPQPVVVTPMQQLARDVLQHGLSASTQYVLVLYVNTLSRSRSRFVNGASAHRQDLLSVKMTPSP